MRRSIGLALMLAALTLPTWLPPRAAEASPASVAELTTRVAAGQLQHAVTHKRELPWSHRTVYTLKAVDAATGQPQGWSWDEAGQLLTDGGAALRYAETAARRASRGALSESLLKIMLTLKAAETYPVLLWLPTEVAFAAKERLLYHKAAQAAQTAAHEAAQTAARDKLLAKAPWLKSRLRSVGTAPAVAVDLTTTEIMKLAPLSEIVEMLPFKPGKPASSTTYVNSIEASYATTSLSGNGVDVCMIEAANPDSSYTEGAAIGGFQCTTNSTNPTLTTHARCSAAMIRSAVSPYGSAKDATQYWGSPANCAGANEETGMRWCASKNIRIWNLGFQSSPGWDALFDFFAKRAPYPLILVPTQQDATGTSACPTSCSNSPAASASNGFSTLIVGGSRDCETSDRSDDMAYCSAWTANPSGGDQEVPHLVAPAFMLIADAYICGSGTSWASALTAGGATQLVEQNSSLAVWPEVLRAILMTTASVSVDHVALDLSDTVDDRDGAGEVDIALANRLAASGSKVNGGNFAVDLGHDYGDMTSAATPAQTFYSEIYSVQTASAGQKLRVVLAWDGSGSCTNIADHNTCTSAGPDADLDIFLYDGNTVVASSVSSDNTYEFIEYSLAPNTTYTLKIKAYSWTNSSTYFGLAWFVGNFTTH